MKATPRQMTLYYVETHLGCGLRAARNLQEATAAALRECGTDSFQQCVKAAEADIQWVRSMGGHVPSTTP